MKTIQYADRVFVFSPGGQILFAVHAERARQLVLEHGYLPVKEGRKIRAIEATEIAPRTRKAPTQPTLASYMGQRYTRTERTQNAAGEIDGRVIQFKHIHHADRPLFLLSVTDCMAR